MQLSEIGQIDGNKNTNAVISQFIITKKKYLKLIPASV